MELDPDILIRKPNTIKGFVFGGRWEKGRDGSVDFFEWVVGGSCGMNGWKQYVIFFLT